MSEAKVWILLDSKDTDGTPRITVAFRQSMISDTIKEAADMPFDRTAAMLAAGLYVKNNLGLTDRQASDYLEQVASVAKVTRFAKLSDYFGDKAPSGWDVPVSIVSWRSIIAFQDNISVNISGVWTAAQPGPSAENPTVVVDDGYTETYHFRQDGEKLTGTKAGISKYMAQLTHDPPVPVEIEDGKVQGTNISFAWHTKNIGTKWTSEGTIKGDEIILADKCEGHSPPEAMAHPYTLERVSAVPESSASVQESNASRSPQEATAGGGEAGIVIDYNLPPGTLRGQILKDFHESFLKQDMAESDMENVQMIEQRRIREFAVVADAIDRAYQSLQGVKKAAFTADYEAAKRDLAKLQEFAVYNCSFPVSADIIRRSTGQSDINDGNYMSTIIVSQLQIDMWHKGMMSWGIYYEIGKTQCWPTDAVTVPPNRISQGGQKIAKGDWQGAWLLNGGRVYVPGVEYFLQTDVAIKRVNDSK